MKMSAIMLDCIYIRTWQISYLELMKKAEKNYERDMELILHQQQID